MVRTDKVTHKCIEWMPWHQTAKKDVASYEKLRRAAKQALTRRYPNGETPSELCRMIPQGKSYLVKWNISVTKEKKSTEIPKVVASEMGSA